MENMVRGCGIGISQAIIKLGTAAVVFRPNTNYYILKMLSFR
ncbi:hypothetical protein SAMN05421877_10388 [Sphingobacterium lactis]|uniref:Uncharacterized protein n=1 Tax=Sphingobacterium lactis TaxID=797291 RepID=A0A1H5VCQ3_9SPHI|nr:hypothetical protein SAMN05421877_10388 [Sphingobacterium lactis]